MKKQFCFRLTDEAMLLLKEIATASGVSTASVLELAIREYAKKVQAA